MSDWTEVELGELASFRNGLNYSASDRGSGLAVVGVSDFQDRLFVDFDALEQLAPSALGTPEALIRKHDILFVRSNGNRELIGRSLLVRSEPKIPTSHSGFTIRLRLEDDRADPRYYAYYLRSGVVRQVLASQGGGTNINNLNQGVLSRLKVPLPPLVAQRRIAGILGAYDDLIEVNRRRVAVLEDMARGLFEDWFVRLRFPGYELVPVHDAAFGLLPEGWRWGTFSELVSEVRLSVQPADIEPEAAYIGLEHLPRRSTTLADRGRPSDVSSTKLRFKRGDILFGKIRPYFHKVVWAPYDGVCSTDAIVWRPVAQLQAQALAIASSDAFVNQSVQTSNGTKMPRANPKVLANFACRIAPADISARFESLCHPLAEAAAQYQAANERLSASRDLLLPRLMSGQLSVVEAEAEAQKELEIA